MASRVQGYARNLFKTYLAKTQSEWEFNIEEIQGAQPGQTQSHRPKGLADRS